MNGRLRGAVRRTAVPLVSCAIAAAVSAQTIRLVDVTEELGIGFRHRHGGSGERYLPETMGAGLAAADFDQDGWTDLFFVQSGWLAAEATNERGVVLRNLGGEAFHPLVVPGLRDTGYGQGVVVGDWSGDGAADLVLLGVGPDLLLRNDRAGGFVPAPEALVRRSDAAASWGSSAALFDADADGDLDLYVVNYLEWSVTSRRPCFNRQANVQVYCHPDAYPAAADVFFRNRDGVLVEDSEMFVVDEPGKGLGVIAADLTGDGLVDVYVANDSTPNFLFVGAPDGSYEESALLFGVSHNAQGRTEAGMGVAVGDVDLDGRTDLLVTHLSLETHTLYRAEPGVLGDVSFTDRTRDSGLHLASRPFTGFGVELLDLDNDRELDLAVANGDVIDNIELTNDALSYRQPGQVFVGRDGRFEELRHDGVAAFRRAGVARGLVGFDLDNDGRQDLAVSYSNGPARVLRNQTAEAGGFLTVAAAPGERLTHLSARQSPASSSGPRHEVGSRSIVRGSSYQSSREPRLHFGLGDVPTLDLDISRACGRRRLRSLPAGRHLLVTDSCG